MSDPIFLPNDLRPTMVRSNARFRGSTELDKYANYIGEAVHDIKLLSKTLDRDEFIFSLERGQTDFIRDNLAAYFSGSTPMITSNIETATHLYGQKNLLLLPSLMNPMWLTYGNTIRTAVDSNGVSLVAPAQAEPSGVQAHLEAQEGQVVYLRMQVRPITGKAVKKMFIGSLNVNQGEGSMKTLTLPAAGQSAYVGYMFDCRQKEQITIDLQLLNEDALAEEIVISDFSVTLIERGHYSLSPLNTSLKSKINVLEEEIRNIINHM